MATNPMHQFEVYRIGPEINLGAVNLSFTNASFFMTISALTILFLLFLGTKKKLLIPSKMQLITEMSYTYILVLSTPFASVIAAPEVAETSSKASTNCLAL